jgi:protein TonB
VSELDKRHPLRRRYYRRVRNALVLAVAAHVGFFLAAPPYRPSPPVMVADPIHLLPGGVALRAAESVSPPPRAVTDAPRAPVPSPAVRAAVEPEIRSEQWLEPVPAPAPQGDERARPPGAGERNAPPVYYDYDVAPRAVRTVEPDYPESARNAGLEGAVVINLNLDERGRILRAWVASSSAPEVLVAAAMDAVYQFEFSPGSSRGVPVRSTVAIPIRFTLKRTT